MSQSTPSDLDDIRRMIHDLATPLAIIELNSRALMDVVSALGDGGGCSGGEALSCDLVRKLEKLAISYLEQADRFRSVFYQYVPEQPSASVRASRPLKDPRPEGPGRRVLLVEDEEVHREIAIKQLADGYEITIAKTAGEALSALKAGCYDVILLDYILPDARGESLVNEIAACGGQAAIYIISNIPNLKINAPDREKVRALLSKPFKLLEFQQAEEGGG